MMNRPFLGDFQACPRPSRARILGLVREMVPYMDYFLQFIRLVMSSAPFPL